MSRGLSLRGQRALLRRGEGARVFACFAAAYVLSYAVRSINAVIGPDVMADLRLSNADLGLLSSAYFLSFAAMQVPLGWWLDRRGARKVETVLLVVAGVGALVFATAQSASTLWLGRALIGAGVSACLMGAYTTYRVWYPASRQSQLSVWMLVAGSAGALSTTLPVQAVLPWLGWRGVFYVMAGLLFLAALALYRGLAKVERRTGRILRAAPSAARTTGGVGVGAAYRALFRHPAFVRVLLFGLLNQASFMALHTLWAGPWMRDVLGFGAVATAQILFVFNLALLGGYLILSWLAPRMARTVPETSRLVMAGGALALVLQGAIAFATPPSAWLLWPLLALSASCLSLILSTLSQAFPEDMAGRANTTYNLVVFGGSFLIQWGLGVGIDAFRDTGLPLPAAFRAAFGVLLGLQCIGFAWYLLVPRLWRPRAAPGQ
ncbi:MFS transporter [Cupriavidus respiraculi]|uniref:MFS transporter n=1 Tax=Cupriavidus respiraculi TaxID=195930 RepID=UPI001C96EB20|nr:MFS transporter [Cupriavidus respiraculi]MBY4946174.1 MFS transporter [Cupriavidus respiraculi]